MVEKDLRRRRGRGKHSKYKTTVWTKRQRHEIMYLEQ